MKIVQSIVQVVVAAALAALTATILGLGAKVSDVSERLARVEAQVTMILQGQRGVTDGAADYLQSHKHKG